MKKRIITEKHTRPCSCGKGIETVTTKIDTVAKRKTISFSSKCKNCGPSAGEIYVPVYPDKRIEKYIKEKNGVSPEQNRKNALLYKEVIDLLAIDNGESSLKILKMLETDIKRKKKK